MDKSNQTYLLDQHLSQAPSPSNFSVDGSDIFTSDHHPSSAPSSIENHVNGYNDEASITIRDMAFVWLALFALYYVCGPRRSQVTIDQEVVQERLRQLREEEAAKKRRLYPEKRKEEINEQIMTKTLARMKKKSLDLPVQICLSCNSDDEEKVTEGESNALDNYLPIPHNQPTDCDVEDGIDLSSCDTDSDIEASCKGNTSAQPQGDSDVDMECSICLDVFEPGDKLSWSRTLRCEHVFHEECLKPWLMTNDECPYCRTKIIGDCCDEDTTGESIEAIMYSDFPSVDNVNSNDEESAIDENAISNLKRKVRRCINYFQPPRRVTRIDTERNETMIFQEYLMDF